MPKKQTYFSERDLRTMNLLIGLLKQSITSVLGAKYARRTLLSNNGTIALYSHAKRGTRNANLKSAEEFKSFFMKCGSKTSLEVNSEQPSTSSEDASAEFAICDKSSDNSTIKPSIDLTKSKYMQQTIDTNIITSDKLKAEIIWALFSVCKGYLNNSAKSLNQTFAAMFPDSPTTQQFQLGSDKLKYICINVASCNEVISIL